MRSLLLPLMPCLAAPPAAAAEKTRILLIWHKHDHPPRMHMYPEVCRLLADCLEQTANVETVLSDGWPADPALLRDVRAVVLYTGPGGDILLNPPHRPAVEALLAGGVGLTAIHWATGADAETGPEYLRLLGGWFNRPLFSTLAFATTRLTQADPAHPICRGWTEYDLHDEYYLNLRFLPEAQPVLKVNLEESEHVVAWLYTRPASNGGRSYGVVLGHFHDAFRDEAFRKLLVNGILWAAHRDVPPEGAPVKVKDDAFGNG